MIMLQIFLRVILSVDIISLLCCNEITNRITITINNICIMRGSFTIRNVYNTSEKNK